MSETTTTASPLTVVLVHGAFADSSSWAGVIERLQAKGVQVMAAANPLRGISDDSAYVGERVRPDPRSGPRGRAFLRGRGDLATPRPARSNVVGLVFVAAFAPDEGEELGEVNAASKDSVLGTALVPHQYPTGSGTGTEFTIDPAKARDAFAADLSDAQAA